MNSGRGGLDVKAGINKRSLHHGVAFMPTLVSPTTLIILLPFSVPLSCFLYLIVFFKSLSWKYKTLPLILH